MDHLSSQDLDALLLIRKWVAQGLKTSFEVEQELYRAVHWASRTDCERLVKLYLKFRPQIMRREDESSGSDPCPSA